MGWPDRYTKQAHSEGFAARSIYKLKEIIASNNLVRKNNTVLDLGCFPGSFCQLLSQLTGPQGTVIGIDQKPTKHLAANVNTFVCDVMSEDIHNILDEYEFDAIFSDMAPRTTGNRALDQGRSADLVEQAWELACQYGKPGAGVVIKYFQGAQTQKFITELRKVTKVKTTKPAASRKESYEMFLIARVPS